MRFILRDGFVYIVNNEGLAGSKIVADVVINYVDNYEVRKFTYSVNGKPYKEFTNGKIILEKEDLDKTYVDLVVKATTKNDVKIFKSDRIPLTYTIIFGEPMADAYPERFRQLEEKMARVLKESEQALAQMKSVVDNTLDYVKELEKRGDIL